MRKSVSLLQCAATKLGFLGCGKMGGALIEGVIQAKLMTADNLILFDKFHPALDLYHHRFPDTKAVRNAQEVVDFADIVILAVKPIDMAPLCQSLASNPRSSDVLYLSVAAGITIKQFTSWLGPNSKIIRCMPNTPSQIGQGYTAISRGSNASEDDVNRTRQIFGAVGLVDEIPEHRMDAITGLSGSGPAYIFTVIEALADGGVLMGLPRDVALRAAAQTVYGSAQMMTQTGAHPSVLRDAVLSPGGTTIAGMEQLEEHGLRNALIKAVRRAAERSDQLSGR